MKAQLITGIIFLLISCKSFAQAGCTDPAANNYNPLAVSNDGSCTYNTTSLSVTAKGNISTGAPESSGLVFTNGAMWTHNDSGNPNTILKVDTANGSLLQTVTITNFPNVDWEDITADSNYIYVSDCGNNNGTRTDLKVLKIAKSQLINNTASTVSVTAQAINLSYIDQTSFASSNMHNFDCESVISIGNWLYLFSKDRGDMQTRVYKLSKTPGTYTVTPYTSYNVNGLITGADYNAQTNEVVLIGYMQSHKNSFLHFLNDFSGDLFFSGNKRRIEIGNAVNDWQTEGVAYTANNEIFISCETSYVPATLYSLSKSPLLATGFATQQANAANIRVYPNPTAGEVTIESSELMQEVAAINTMDEVVFMKQINERSLQLDLPNGVYVLSIKAGGEVGRRKLVVAR